MHTTLKFCLLAMASTKTVIGSFYPMVDDNHGLPDAVGDSCKSDSDCGDATFFCLKQFGVPRKCYKRQNVDEICNTSNACMQGLTCEKQVCTKPGVPHTKDVGKKCKNNGDCTGDGEYCFQFTKICVKRNGDGASCFRSDWCQSGKCQSGACVATPKFTDAVNNTVSALITRLTSAPLLAEKKKLVGEDCDADDDCDSGYCFGFRFMPETKEQVPICAYPVGFGSPCQANSNCYNGTCDARTSLCGPGKGGGSGGDGGGAPAKLSIPWKLIYIISSVVSVNFMVVNLLAIFLSLDIVRIVRGSRGLDCRKMKTIKLPVRQPTLGK